MARSLRSLDLELKDGSRQPPAQDGGRNAEADFHQKRSTTPMLRPPIRMPGSTARIKARRRSCASSGMADEEPPRLASGRIPDASRGAQTDAPELVTLAEAVQVLRLPPPGHSDLCRFSIILWSQLVSEHFRPLCSPPSVDDSRASKRPKRTLVYSCRCGACRCDTSRTHSRSAWTHSFVSYRVCAPIANAVCQRMNARGGMIRTATLTGSIYQLALTEGPAVREASGQGRGGRSLPEWMSGHFEVEQSGEIL